MPANKRICHVVIDPATVGRARVGLSELHMDFSHVSIFEALVQAANINASLEQALYAALQSKDKALVASLAADLPAETKAALVSLTNLNGDVSILDIAEKSLPKLPAIKKALADLRAVAAKISTTNYGSVNVHISFDLCELRGYNYHSGIVFAAYAKGYAGPIALGGRYDEVGLSFGRARPATGFSLDLRGAVTSLPPASLQKAILAPASNDATLQASLQASIDALRGQGEVVIQLLTNESSSPAELGCDRELRKQNNDWVVLKLS